MAIPTGIATNLEGGFDLVESGITEATSLMTSNWILFFGLCLAILSIGVGFIKKIKRM